MTRFLSKQLPDRSVFYMHPYEVDADELDFVKQTYGKLPLKWRLTQFVGRESVPKKLSRLINDYDMTSFREAYYSAEQQSAKKVVLSSFGVTRLSQLTA